MIELFLLIGVSKLSIMLAQFAYADMAVLNSVASEMYTLSDIFDHNSPNQIQANLDMTDHCTTDFCL